MTILDELAAYAKTRVSQKKEKVPLEEIRRMAEGSLAAYSFMEALKKPGISFICECKKASPSKGLIEPDFDHMKIAKDYEAAGADAISVLTEPRWFLGNDSYLKDISSMVSIPCLRKDFTVNEYMIYEAKTLGASAILLICSILDDSELKSFMQLARELSLDVLTEAHDEKEVERAMKAGAKIIGVNNRNLKDFSVDPQNTARLRGYVSDGTVFIAESGVRNADDVAELAKIGVDGILIGEALMRSDNKAAKLTELKSLINL